MGKRSIKNLKKKSINRLGKPNELYSETLRKSKLHKSNVAINKDNILDILMTTDDSELETRRYELTSKMIQYYGYPTEYRY